MVVCDRCKRGDVGLRKVTFSVTREADPGKPQAEPVKVEAEHLCQSCEDRSLTDLGKMLKGNM